ncbi:MAG: hypothetical protein AAFZ15_14850 [Bacteroidota bacterium]
MKFKFPYLLLFAFLRMTTIQAESGFGVPAPESDNFTVYIFLGEECIISQQYTLLLRQLHSTYSSDRVNFIGLFPNPSSNEKKMETFKGKYQLPFELKQDFLQQEMDRFGIKVTPEVVVFNESKKEVVYQGRIDNMFFRVGKRRTVTTTSELEDVLEKIKNQELIIFHKTQAVGCFITPLDADLKNIQMCKTIDGGR